MWKPSHVLYTYIVDLDGEDVDDNHIVLLANEPVEDQLIFC